MIEKIVKCTAKLQLGGLQSSDILRRPPKICPIFHIFAAISEHPNFNESAIMHNSILLKILRPGSKELCSLNFGLICFVASQTSIVDVIYEQISPLNTVLYSRF